MPGQLPRECLSVCCSLWVWQEADGLPPAVPSVTLQMRLWKAALGLETALLLLTRSTHQLMSSKGVLQLFYNFFKSRTFTPLQRKSPTPVWGGCQNTRWGTCESKQNFCFSWKRRSLTSKFFHGDFVQKEHLCYKWRWRQNVFILPHQGSGT